MWVDIVFEHPFEQETLRRALAAAFEVESAQVEVLEAAAAGPTGAPVSAVVEEVEGDFQWLVSVSVEPALERPLLPALMGIANDTMVRALAPEIGADDPFWMLLVAPHREPTRVELDVDDYDVAEFCLAGPPPPERCAVV